MFNKILKEIKTELKEIKTNADIINRIYELIRDTRTQNNTIETLANTNRNQAKIINQLYNEKFGEEDTRFDTVVLIPYRGKPKVYKDGQKIHTDKANSLTVNWASDSRTEVNVYND